MKKMIRRTAAAVLSLAIVGGVAAPVSGVSPLINTSITANAAPNAKTIEGTVYTLDLSTGSVDDIIIGYDDALILKDVYVQFDDRYNQGWGIQKFTGTYRFSDIKNSGYYYAIGDYGLENVNTYTLSNIDDGSMEVGEDDDIWCVRYGSESKDTIIAGVEITTGTGTADDPYVLEPYTLVLSKVLDVECIDNSLLRFNMVLPHGVDSVTFSGADGDVTYTRENDFAAANTEAYYYNFDYPFTLANADKPVSITVTAYGKPDRIVKTFIQKEQDWDGKYFSADTSADTYVPKDYLSEYYAEFVNGKYILGDVNFDGMLSLLDSNYLYKYVNGDLELSSAETEYIETVGDIFCPGDGVDEKDCFALAVAALNGEPFSGPYPVYGSVPEFDNKWKATGNSLYGENYVIGASLTLDGSIGVNFQVNLDENVKKAVLDGPSGEVVITDFDNCKHTGYGAIYSFDGTPSYVNYEDGSYVLSYYVDATQMNDKVTLRLYDENDNLLDISNSSHVIDPDKTIEYSIADYINNYKSTDEKTDALVDALANYSKAASNYFNGTDYSIEGIDDIDTSDLDELAGVLYSDLKLSLVLDTKTSIRVYSDNTTIKLDGQKPEMQTSKYGNFYEIPNIAAHELTELHTLTMENDGPLMCSFSPMMYVKRVLENPNASVKLKNVAKAIYAYAMAAKNYNA